MMRMIHAKTGDYAIDDHYKRKGVPVRSSDTGQTYYFDTNKEAEAAIYSGSLVPTLEGLDMLHPDDAPPEADMRLIRRAYQKMKDTKGSIDSLKVKHVLHLGD